MTWNIWVYYTMTVVVLTAIPGPSILLCVSQAVSQDFVHALYGAVGNMVAIVGVITLSFTGLGMIVASSDIVFSMLKYLGAAYLVYLGYQAWRSKEEHYVLEERSDMDIGRKRVSFMHGFLVGASNPKTTLFFVAFFPQFIDPSYALFGQYVIFTSTFVASGFFWLIFYSYLGYRSSAWFLKKGRAKFFNRLTGTLFVGAAVLLSFSRRGQ